MITTVNTLGALLLWMVILVYALNLLGLVLTPIFKLLERIAPWLFVREERED